MLSGVLAAAAAALLFQAAPAAAPVAPAAPTAASAATATPASAPVPAKPAKPKLICRSEPVIGSLMPKKTCYTEDAAKERQQAERQNLETLQDRSH